jgi:hypothetical protein
MQRKFFIVVIAVCAAAGLVRPCLADEAAEKGRDILAKNQHGVVTVEVVQKASSASSGRTSETRQDLTGTVVDPSGLTVLSLAACDPAEIYRRMLSEEYSQYKVEIEISDIKILLDDGTEIPAEIVLRDKDLDLAFIRPKTKLSTPMTAVDLAKCSPAQVLDEVITLNRLNRATGRAYGASVERICAVVQKPRTFYVPDSTATSTTLGSPAFALNGNLLGVVVMRTTGGGGGGRSSYREGVTSIILPADDILKAAKQAPEAKGDDEKKETPKDPKDPVDSVTKSTSPSAQK